MSAFFNEKTALAVLMAEADSCEPLSRQQERVLARAYHAGDKKAGNQLVQANLRFVIAYAKRFMGCGLEFEDLIQEGNMGLVRALAKYNPDRENSRDKTTNVKFISYAQYWMKAMILRAIVERGRTVRMSRSLQKTLRRIRLADAKFTAQHGREATVDELASELAMRKADVRAAQPHLSAGSVSLDALELAETSGLEVRRGLVAQQPPADEQLSRMRTNAEIAEAVSRATPLLPPRERKILMERVLCDDEDAKGLAELGRDMGVSRERARQLETRLKDRLRPVLANMRG